MRKFKLSFDRVLNYRAAALAATLEKHVAEGHGIKSLRFYSAGFEEGWRQALAAVKQEIEQ